MMRLNADPEVVRYTGDTAFTDEAEAAAIVAALQAQYAERRMGRFIVLERDTGAPVGWCGLRGLAAEGAADLGYRCLQARWGRGYATEAGAACVRYGFEVLGLDHLIAQVMPENVASARVLEKLGFAAVGETRCAGMPATRYCLTRGG